MNNNKTLLFHNKNKLVFINRTQENISPIGLSFNYYDVNIFLFHFSCFFSHVYHHRSSILQFLISLHTICYSYSPTPKSICNFAWLVIRLLLVWWRGRYFYVFLYQKTNQKIYTFILIQKDNKISESSCRIPHSTDAHSPHRTVFPIILHCARKI